MSNDRPVIDLSGGQYDDLEHRIAERLNIKALLIRDWNPPRMCSREFNKTTGEVIYGSNDPEIQHMTDLHLEWIRKTYFDMEFDGTEDPEKIAQRNHLRAYIFHRDQELGLSMTDDELRSLQEVRHVTLRDGNCAPEKAVIIFDSRPDAEELKKDIFASHFDNAFVEIGDDGWKLPFSDFIENFDIAPEDYRTLTAFSRVRYALQNQTEYSNLNKGMWYEPFYYNFARLSRDPNNGLHKGYYEMSFREACERHLPESILCTHHEGYGIRDENLSEKLMHAGAVMNLYYDSLLPMNTFARLHHDSQISAVRDHQIAGYAQIVKQAVEKEIETLLGNQEHSGIRAIKASSDLRVLIPVFRKIKDTLTFEGLDPNIGKKYINAIWEGAQRYFPALASAPVPDLLNGPEPPRTAMAYHTTGQKPPPPVAGMGPMKP